MVQVKMQQSTIFSTPPLLYEQIGNKNVQCRRGLTLTKFCQILKRPKSVLAHRITICPSSLSISSSLSLSYTFHIFIFFSRTTGSISTKLGTKHPWMIGIYFCSNEGPCSFPRVDNNKLAKIHWRTLKNFFWRTTGPNNQTWHIAFLGMGIHVCLNEGPAFFQGKIIRKWRKYIDEL